MTGLLDRLNEALSGRYEIVRQIGEGGMATVYLAEDLKHRRKVALKVLKPELAAIVGAERFLAEIETTAHLQHPNILPLFDSGEADGSVFFVMPYVEDETLRQRLGREKQLPVDEAVRIARDVAEALDHAHRQGVIHRDIKPGNILLRDGRPLVADFGIALAASRSGGDRLTETGMSLGTPYYMSPEQATGSQVVGPATDVYALGCVLYEMLVGEPPYTGSTPQAILGKIITGEAKSASAQRRSVPLNVDGAVAKSIEKLPADRFASAQEFAKALGDPAFRHRAEAGIGAGAGRLWNPLSAALSAAVFFLALVVVWLLPRSTARAGPSSFVLTPPPGVDLTGTQTGGIEGFAVSPDGETIVYVDGSTGQLYRHPLGALDGVPILGAENAAHPFFSPDGEWLGYFDQAEDALRKIRLDGSQGQTLATFPSSGTASGAWSSDGAIVLTSDGLGTGFGLWRVRDTGGDLERIDGTESLYVRWLDLLPDGRTILATTGAGAEIVGVSLETGEEKILFAGMTPRYLESGHIVFWLDGAIWATPFDPERLEVLAPPALVLEGVSAQQSLYAHFSVGGDVLFHRQGANTDVGGVAVWLARDGSEEVVDPRLRGGLLDPAVSPNGTRIAISYRSTADVTSGRLPEIWVYDREQGGTFYPLGSRDYDVLPFWSPDSREVAFSSLTTDSSRLYSRPVDRSGEARLLLSGAGPDRPSNAGWTPDGRWIVYHSQGRDLWYRAPHPDSTAHRITDTGAIERNPSVSPDGGWLAYESDESGRFEIYVRPFPGPGGQRQISTDGGIMPVWAHNSPELFYIDGAGYLTAASLLTDPALRVESREPLFPWAPIRPPGGDPQYGVLPDDQTFLAIRPLGREDEGEARYVVVQNFSELLRQAEPE